MKTWIVRLYGLYLNLLTRIAPARAAEKGFLLFCKPFRLPISNKQLDFFNTAEQFMIEHEGHLVQGYKWGCGEQKILFLHGWQSHTYRWKPYIEALSQQQFTIYAIDAPGHGLSSGNFLSVPLYSTLIETFIRERGPFHSVVGHSLGGFSLLYTLYRFPLLQVNKLVLMAPPGEASEFIDVFKSTLGLSEKTVELIVDHFTSRYEVGPEFFSTIRFAESVNVSGIIIHDEEDTEAPYKHSPPLEKIWKRSKLITTKGFGHNLRSMEVVKHVVDYVSEKEPVTAE